MRIILVLVFLLNFASANNFQQGTMPSEKKANHSTKEKVNPKSKSSEQALNSTSSPTRSSANTTDEPASDPGNLNKERNVKVLSAPKIVVEPIKDFNDWTMLVCTGILTLVGIVGTCAAIKTLRAIQSQARIMQHHARSLVMVANAAKKSAGTAETALRLCERADVLLQEAIVTEDGKGFVGLHSKVILNFKNFGRTRANNVRFTMRLFIPDSREFPSRQTAPMVIGAGDIQPVVFPPLGEYLAQDFGSVFSGQRDMHFAGQVVYEDVFGTSYKLYCSGVFDHTVRAFIVKENHAE